MRETATTAQCIHLERVARMTSTLAHIQRSTIIPFQSPALRLHHTSPSWFRNIRSWRSGTPRYRSCSSCAYRISQRIFSSTSRPSSTRWPRWQGSWDLALHPVTRIIKTRISSKPTASTRTNAHATLTHMLSHACVYLHMHTVWCGRKRAHTHVHMCRHAWAHAQSRHVNLTVRMLVNLNVRIQITHDLGHLQPAASWHSFVFLEQFS